MKSFTKTISTGALLLLAVTATAQDPAPTPDALNHPFSSRDEVETFLRTADIVREKGAPRGVTNPRRLTLDDGKVQNDAIFKMIDERKMGITRLEDTKEFDFKDSWKFEVAAYEIDKLLSLNMVPVTVARTYQNRKGSLQYWVDDCILEKDRKDKNMQPPNPIRWMWQTYKVRIFDRLIYNIDRNLGNLLVTKDWRVVMIDHSRAFKSVGQVDNLDKLDYFSRSMMNAMSQIDEVTLQEKCAEILTGSEIKTLLQRRDVIVEYYKKRVEEKGNSIVFP